MRLLPLLMTTLVPLLAAGACRATETSENRTKLEFLPPQKIGPRALAARGPAGEPAIEITGEQERTTTTILIATDPQVGADQYILRGQVKYEGVKGDGYLEMWNDFGDQGQFFTRTMGDSGPIGKLTGSSSWRDFVLPFRADKGMRPRKLTINLVLPGPGTVTVAQPTIADLAFQEHWLTPTRIALISGMAAIGGGLLAWLGVKFRRKLQDGELRRIAAVDA